MCAFFCEVLLTAILPTLSPPVLLGSALILMQVMTEAAESTIHTGSAAADELCGILMRTRSAHTLCVFPRTDAAEA